MPARHKITEAQVISLGLLAFYATTVLIYWPLMQIPDIRLDVTVLVALYALMTMGAVGLFMLKEWGRVLVVYTNILTAGYSLKLYLASPEVVPMTYIFMNIIIPIFFSQVHEKIKFATDRKINWKSILIVDDDEGIIKLLRPMLMTNGYAVLTALNGEDGLQIARVQKPDLILLDVILPGIKGRDVCKKLKEDQKTKNIPVVFLTSKDSADDIHAEKAVGAIAHLTKPVNSKELVSTIGSILG